MDSHVKDKTISQTVLSLAWESPYLGKTVFILRRGPDSLLLYGIPVLIDKNKIVTFKTNRLIEAIGL